MPTLSRPWGLGSAASTSNTRLLGSAEGEMRVMRPPERHARQGLGLDRNGLAELEPRDYHVRHPENHLHHAGGRKAERRY